MPPTASSSFLSPGPQAVPLGEQATGPGLVLYWGADVSPALLASRPAVTQAAALLRFVLNGQGSRGGSMTLLRPAELGGCAAGASQASFHATIALSGDAWRVLIGDDKTPGASDVRQFARDPTAPSVSLPLTPAARLAVESTRRCPFGGACREMALSARCHDLVLEFLSAMAARTATRPATLLQSVEDQVRIAAELLRHHLDSPFSVTELARRVGVSETTLKRGFRQVFATTVIGYLRSRRMEHAHALLQSGRATVLEAAAFVGYSNPSNFAAAFRRQFGVNPKQFQLAVRR